MSETALFGKPAGTSHSDAKPETPVASVQDAPLNTAPNEPEASTEESQVEGATYSARGIPNLRIGKWQFENGRLSVPADEVEKFDKLLTQVDRRTQSAVHKIDVAGGEEVARRYRESQGAMKRGGDDTSNVVPAPNPADRQA